MGEKNSSKQMVFAEDMNEEMQELAIGAATAAFQKTFVNGNVYAQIAAHIRQDFDERDGKGWNCVVGRSFGAFVTHKIKTFIYFSVRISKYLSSFFAKLHNIRSNNIATTITKKTCRAGRSKCKRSSLEGYIVIAHCTKLQ